MSARTIRLFGGPWDGRDVDADMPGHRWIVGCEEQTEAGRRWAEHYYDPRTGKYLGVKS